MKVTLKMVGGREYVLSGGESSSPVLAVEGALSELVGKISRQNLEVPSIPGVIPGVGRFGAIEAEMNFYLHAEDGDEMERVYREFRSGWSFTKPVTLMVESPAGKYSIGLFLGAAISGEPVDMTKRLAAVVPVTVFSPRGLFRGGTNTKGGNVTVTNRGDATVYPRIRYTGGGTILYPSGAIAPLPKTTVERIIDLDPLQLREAGLFSEGVEPGKTGTYQLPAGAVLEWEILVADPWANH